MYWAAVATRSMSYQSIGEQNFLMNYMASPPVAFRAHVNTVPVNRIQFTSSVLDITLYPNLYVPFQGGSVDVPYFSIGDAISRQRFADHTDLRFVARQLIAENPVLFVPGSYHTDMTALGMPPLTNIMERDLMAYRARMADEAVVRFQNRLDDWRLPVSPAPPRIRAQRPPALVRSRFLDLPPRNLPVAQPGRFLFADEPAAGLQDNIPVPPQAPIPVAAPVLEFRAIGEDCPICLEPLHEEGSIPLLCGHRHHAICLSRLDPQRCPDCRAIRFPSRDALYEVMHSEVMLLRNQKNALSDELKETTLERDSLRVELVGEKEIHTLYDSEHAELLDTREKLKLTEASSTLEVKTLKERIKMISFAAEASLSSAVKCASDIASMACELVKENNTLRVESRPGFMLRRVTDQRNGFVKLVESMGRVNGNMSRKIDALEIELKRSGDQLPKIN
jgi:hypothetical protein